MISYSSFKKIPVDFKEVASIDGYSVIRIFYKIVLTFTRVVIVTVATIQIILAWSEYPFKKILLFF